MMDFESSEYPEKEEKLPQCKIKRNYSCNHCLYFTQNPRFHLAHLRDVHGERITINNCNLCLYASRHYQKLVRHLKMVHGSTVESIRAHQTRKRPITEDIIPSDCTITRPLSPLPPLPEFTIDLDSLSYDLKSSRKTLRDIFAICCGQDDIQDILDQMEASDIVEVVPIRRDNLPLNKPSAGTIFGDPKLIGEDELCITCGCGYSSKSFFEIIIHGKSCSIANEKNDETSPLDLSISSVIGDCSTFLTNDAESKQPGSRRRSMENESCAEDTQVDLRKNTENQGPIKEEVETNTSEENEMVTTVTKPPKEEITHSHRKVFKCPLCSFWASTASRFHVHIVGHQNKKPFKCSVCSYRSNWRWDITKHIRLRSIRSQNHKNARVLIQGDHGPHSYAKYNSCITLMKVSGQDGDMKLKKCGEMPPSDDDSAEIPNDLDTAVLKEEITDQDCQEEEQQIKLSASLDLGTSAKPLKSNSKDDNSDNQTHTELKRCLPRNCLFLEYGENPVYKCNMCQFKHPNRDAVLVHVKMLHEDMVTTAKTAPSEACLKTKRNLNFVELTRVQQNCNINVQDPKDSKMMPNENNSLREVKSSMSDTESIPLDVENDDAVFSPAKGSLENDDKAALKAIFVTPQSGSEINKMPSPAPFRCGYCHQVSNWKHVIQRHCRLKHFGSIRIEAIDRSNNAYPPVYRPLDQLTSIENFPVKTPHKIKQERDELKSEKQPCSVSSDRKSTKTTLKKSNIVQETPSNSLNKHANTEKSSNNSIPAKPETTNEIPKSLDSVTVCAGRKNISVKKMTLEKCPYCLFESSCHSAMKCHEQSHYRVLKNSQTIQKVEHNSKLKQESSEQKRSNIKPIRKSVKSDNKQNKEHSTPIGNATLKCDPEPEEIHKGKSSENEKMLKVQNSKTVSTSTKNIKKTSMLPSLSSQNTIFVNPKTGKVVRRN